MRRGRDNDDIEGALIVAALVEQTPAAASLALEFGDIGGGHEVAMPGQVFRYDLHSRHPDESLRRHIAVDDLTLVELDDPAVPGPHDAVGLPGRDDIPEQRVIDREILRAVVEFVRTGAETGDPPTRENALFEHLDLIHQPLERGAAGQSRHAGADDGD